MNDGHSPEKEGGPRAALRLSGLDKSFGLTRALDDVHLEVGRGEIHALVGGNGSGKSTLIKILAGVHRADRGELEIWGDPVDLGAYSTKDAHAAGFRFVHQNAPVFLEMTVAENIAIGSGYAVGRAGNVRWPELRRHTRDLLARFEIDVSPGTRMAELGPATQMMVAIAGALQLGGRDDRSILVLDEPTASLPAHEVELLLNAVRRYAEQGQTTIYVSHRLDEVLVLADRVSALRDGIAAGTMDAAEATEATLIQMVAGRALERVYPAMPSVSREPVVLELDGVDVGPLRNVSFTLRRREILGLAGLLGSGRSELLQAIFGAMPITRGKIVLNGELLDLRRPADAIASGIALIPEDREASAFPDLGIQQNLAAADFSRGWTGVRLSGRRERETALVARDRFLIKAGDVRAPLSTLSGGNQQKVILARWLTLQPRVLLLDEPTQGVDIGARWEIYRLINAALEDGACALIVSSDFEELSQVCERVIVLRGGTSDGEILAPDIDAPRLAEYVYSNGGTAS